MTSHPRPRPDTLLGDFEGAVVAAALADPSHLSEARKHLAILRNALRAALSAPPEEPPTYNDEPPWPGWFSCPECFGWFNDEGAAYEDGAVLCEACADERDAAAARHPSPPPAPESTIDADAIIARGRSPTAPSSGGTE